MSHYVSDTGLTTLTALECVAYETFYTEAKAYYVHRIAWGLSLDKPCSDAFRKLYLTLHRSLVDGWLLEHLDDVRWLSNELASRAKMEAGPVQPARETGGGGS